MDSENNNQTDNSLSSAVNTSEIGSDPQPTVADVMPPSGVQPSQTINPTSPSPSGTDSGPSASNPVIPSAASRPKKSLPLKKIGMLIASLIVLVLVGIVAYVVGKHHEKVITQAPPLKPVNLPLGTIVLNNCVPGRGKQYIIPQDIPQGPIYDVNSSNKVIAIEYNVNLEQVVENSDTFSNTIINATRNYPVDHLALTPDPSSPTTLHLVMFVVTKQEANAITCPTTTTTPSTSSSTSKST